MQETQAFPQTRLSGMMLRHLRQKVFLLKNVGKTCAPEYAPEELNHSMASNTNWVSILRQAIKKACGKGWSVRGRESKGELITQVTFRYPDNQDRTAANMNLA